MKKLMIVAAAVALALGVEAAAQNKYAQVYDVSMKLKTTRCKDVKASKAIATYLGITKGADIAIRKQATINLNGVIFGCWCPTIGIPAWRVLSANGSIGGYMFWDATAKELYPVSRTKFQWALLNRYDDFKKAEGTFVLSCNAKNKALFLVGGGFGTVSGQGCNAYMPRMSGNVAGFMQGDYAGTCVYCVEDSCVVRPFCDWCYDRDTRALTTAFGTWNIKYNNSVATKLSKSGRLSKVYTFKNAGTAAVVLAKLEDWAKAGMPDAEEIEEYDWEELELADLAEPAGEEDLEDYDLTYADPVEGEAYDYEGPAGELIDAFMGDAS